MSLAKMIEAGLPVISFIQPLKDLNNLSLNLSSLAKEHGYLPVIAQYIPVVDEPSGAIFFVICKTSEPDMDEINNMLSQYEKGEQDKNESDEDVDASKSTSEENTSVENPNQETE